MPALLEHKKSAYNVRNFIDDEPPLTYDEVEQLDSAYEDMENGTMISWEEAKKILAEIP